MAITLDGTAGIFATGNVTAGNLIGNLAAANGSSNVRTLSDGNVAISAANTANVLVVTGTGANVAGTLDVSGNATVSNLTVTGTLDAGDITVSSISNGTSNVDIVGVSGNVTTSVGGTPNVLIVTGTGANVAGTLNATGNANVGNLGTAGLITATGNITATANVTGGNLTTAGLITATGNITATANVTGGNLTTAGLIAATGNITATANVTGGNLITAGIVTATGNVSGGNLTTSGNVSGGNVIATANVIGGNLVTTGVVSATGNANVGNIGATAVVASTLTGTLTTNAQPNITSVGSLNGLSVSGNIVPTANISYDLGNITNRFRDLYLSNSTIYLGNSEITAGAESVSIVNPLGGQLIIEGTQTVYGNNIIDGTSNVTVAANANITVSVAGVANTVVFTSSGANIAGTLNATGNANVGNLGTTGLVIATGNVSGDNVNATANVVGGNLVTAGVVTATGNISGGNINTSESVNAANVKISSLGNQQIAISSNGLLVGGPDLVWQFANARLWTTGIDSNGAITTSGLVTATGNVTGGNLTTAGMVTATGNITTAGNLTASYLIGNGSQLSGIDATAIQNGTANVKTYLDSNVAISAAGSANVLVVTGTGANITGTLNATGNANVGNLGTAGLITATGNITATANVTGGNLITAGSLSVNGNANVGNLGTSGLITATGNITATANVTGGNITTAGLITATGNVSGGNLTTVGQINATGNITATANVNSGNLTTTGVVTAVGNVISGNVVANANVVAGNLTTTGVLSVTGTGVSRIAGTLDMTGNLISNLATPVASTDATTKQYVDDLASTALVYHQAVIAATTDTLANTTGGTITYNNGASGVGANLVTTGSFNLIDAANVQTVGTRILVKNEANAAHNGIYTWSNATVIVRSIDADEYGAGAGALSLNDYFFVSGGVVNKGSAYVLDSPSGTITFGTSNISFAQFSSSQVYLAGTGLTLNSLTFSIADTAVTPSTYGGSDRVASFTVNAQGQLTAAGNVVIGANAANLTGTTLASSVVTSSLTTVGQLGTLSVSGNANVGNIGATTVVASTLSGTLATNAQPNITSVGALTGLSVSGSIIPTANITYDLGNTTNRFRDLWLSNSTIYLGNSNITSGANSVSISNPVGGQLVITGSQTFYGNNIIDGTSNVTVTPNANVTVSVSGNANIVAVTGTGANIAGTLNATGNANVGNLGTAGLITATGNITATANVTGGNLTTAGIVTATGNVSGGNITTAGVVAATGNITATGNVTGGNITTAGLMSATGNITATGNVTGGNITTAGLISATGNITATANITGGNITTAGLMSATGNITATGNVIAGNVTTTGVVIATGNITGGNLLGVHANGTSNVNIPTLNGNVNTSVGGNANILIVTGTGANVTGTLNSTGNANVGNLGTAGLITATGNITATANVIAGNVTTTGVVIATGNITGGNLLGAHANGNSNVNINTAGGNIALSVAGVSNVWVLSSTGANLTGTFNATGNANVGNIGATAGVFTGNVSATGNVSVGNLLPTSNIVAAGATSIITGASGNVSIAPGGTNVLVATTTGVVLTGTLTFASGGNVSAGNILNTNANGVGNIGNSTNYYNTVFAKATSAQYADLAEMYVADAYYEPGTVLSFGGNYEVTCSTVACDAKVAGVVSQNPSYLMNSTQAGEHVVAIALVGRVPTFVQGPVLKGDMMVSAGNGMAMSCSSPSMGTVIGKALEDFHGTQGKIEIVVGRL